MDSITIARIVPVLPVSLWIGGVAKVAVVVILSGGGHRLF